MKIGIDVAPHESALARLSRGEVDGAAVLVPG